MAGHRVLSRGRCGRSRIHGGLQTLHCCRCVPKRASISPRDAFMTRFEIEVGDARRFSRLPVTHCQCPTQYLLLL